MTPIKTVIFDLGNVLIDWNPEYVFTDTYFPTPEAKTYFFFHICTMAWNEEQDAGRSIVEATQELIAQFPDWEKPIRDYYGRWTEMLKGPIHESVKILQELKANKSLRIFALTNWQAGLFDIALVRYDFLHWFDGRVVSGEENTRKPFPEIYLTLFNRYGVKPEESVFIDDSLRNIKGAEAVGLQTIHFTNAIDLRNRLQALQLL